MNRDEIQGEAITEAVKFGLDFTDSKILPMSFDKQADLANQPGLKPGEREAYLSACCYWAAILNLETIAGKVMPNDPQPEAFFRAAVDSGSIDGASAGVMNYTQLAHAFGVTVKDYTIFDAAPNRSRIFSLLNAGTPLVVYLGTPGHLNHVEAIRGRVTSNGDTWLYLVDPGWQNDFWLRLSDLAVGHFKDGVFVRSVIHDGTPRYAYKFGYYST